MFCTVATNNVESRSSLLTILSSKDGGLWKNELQALQSKLEKHFKCLTLYSGQKLKNFTYLEHIVKLDMFFNVRDP